MYPFLLSTCFLWQCKTERKASSKMRCKPVCFVNFSLGLELFKDEHRYFFVSFHDLWLQGYEAHFPPPIFLVSMFRSHFSPSYTNWLGLISERSRLHLSKARGEAWIGKVSPTGVSVSIRYSGLHYLMWCWTWSNIFYKMGFWI